MYIILYVLDYHPSDPESVVLCDDEGNVMYFDSALEAEEYRDSKGLDSRIIEM